MNPPAPKEEHWAQLHLPCWNWSVSVTSSTLCSFMAIIVSKKGSAPAQLVEKSEFEKERNLQEYIHQHPESIPVYEIREDKRLFVAAREFPTESGPIDALAVDKDGDIYIVETKLHRSSDKRAIVAQALDYGASLWKHSGDFSEFLKVLKDAVQETWKTSFQDKVKELFSLDDEQIEVLLEAMRINLREGSLKFVILMDAIDERLKDLITYVNQNSQFDIYAVQLEYYKHDEFEIVIPKLFGAEVKKDSGVSPRSSIRQKWDEQKILLDARQKMAEEEYVLFERIYRFAKEEADQIKFGTGAYGTFSPIFRKLSSKSLFTLGADKRLSFNFDWVVRDNPQIGDAYKLVLEKIGFHLPGDFKVTRPSVPISEWGPKTDAFIGAVKGLL